MFAHTVIAVLALTASASATIATDQISADQISTDQIAGPTTITRADDGLFYLVGDVNGERVVFLIDTGASAIMLTSEDAARAGAARSTRAAPISTVNGVGAMDSVLLTNVAIGSQKRGLVSAFVSPKLKVSLLGASWLARYRSIRITRDTMTLR